MISYRLCFFPNDTRVSWSVWRIWMLTFVWYFLVFHLSRFSLNKENFITWTIKALKGKKKNVKVGFEPITAATIYRRVKTRQQRRQGPEGLLMKVYPIGPILAFDLVSGQSGILAQDQSAERNGQIGEMDITLYFGKRVNRLRLEPLFSTLLRRW